MLENSVLVVGADSPIGATLASRLDRAGLDVFKTTHRAKTVGKDRYYLDLASLKGLRELPKCGWTVIVASETRFALCERDPELTDRINRTGPIEIARHALGHGGRVFFFSSIAVHDGQTECPAETLEPKPNSAYGRQKRGAEVGLLDQSDGVVIMRPSKVVIPGYALFDQWRADLRSAKVITPFEDMVVAPIWLDDLVEACYRLMMCPGAGGIYQMSANRQLSYADIAAYLIEQGGYDLDLLNPGLARDKPSAATLWLPRFATLCCDRLQDAANITAPDPTVAVNRYLNADTGKLAP